MNRVTGSGAFIAVCRSAWLIAGDPNDAEKRRRILAPIKNNLGDDKTGFAYTIESVTLANGISTSRVVFDPIRVHMSADELLQQITPAARRSEGCARRGLRIPADVFKRRARLCCRSSRPQERRTRSRLPLLNAHGRHSASKQRNVGRNGTYRCRGHPRARKRIKEYQEDHSLERDRMIFLAKRINSRAPKS